MNAGWISSHLTTAYAVVTVISGSNHNVELKVDTVGAVDRGSVMLSESKMIPFIAQLSRGNETWGRGENFREDGDERNEVKKKFTHIQSITNSESKQAHCETRHEIKQEGRRSTNRSRC